MPRTFQTLQELLETNPSSYKIAIADLQRTDPAKFDAFVEHMRLELATAHEAVDRPLNEAEVEELIGHLGAVLNWPRRRVLSEALLRLREAALAPAFTPLTPEETLTQRKGRYLRRHSSIRALVLGDIAKAVAQHKAK